MARPGVMRRSRKAPAPRRSSISPTAPIICANSPSGRSSTRPPSCGVDSVRASGRPHVFENDLPRRKIGVLSPLSVIDNGAYEFYRLVSDRIMLVMIPVGLAEFSGQDVERVFAPIDSYLDKLMERRVDIVMQSGVPLPVLIGVAAHDRLIAHMAEYTKVPATSSVLGIVEAA